MVTVLVIFTRQGDTFEEVSTFIQGRVPTLSADGKTVAFGDQVMKVEVLVPEELLSMSNRDKLIYTPLLLVILVLVLQIQQQNLMLTDQLQSKIMQ